MFEIVGPALLLSIILLGIHSYFGIEIIRRGIIFTDLAIGQMAALGAAVSIMFFHGEYIYYISLIFALIGGFLNTAATRRSKHPEAFIGLMYALGVSGIALLLSRSPHGTEELNNLMAADILFTPLQEIIYTAILYTCLGIILVFIKKIERPLLREILFFSIFAITVTSSVKIAGVFVVFTLLIGPAYISLKLRKDKNLMIAWITGTFINLPAVIASYHFDLPTSYAIVFLNSFLAISISLLKKRSAESFN